VEVQKFIRTALRSNSCRDQPPLIVDVDDYLGPQTKGILGELAYSTVLSQLAKWYDIAAISYPEVVRDVVYANTSDSTFFNQENIHYGYTAHQTIAWSVGFGALELVSNYCDDEYWQRKESQTETDLKRQKVQERQKVFLPPVLRPELLLSNATNEFNAAFEAAHIASTLADVKCNDMNNITSAAIDHNPCIVAWISMHGGYNKQKIARFMDRYKLDRKPNSNWVVENKMSNGWTNKIGWAAVGRDAQFTLAFDDIKKRVDTVTILYMKSYSEKWEGSRIRVTITGGNKTSEHNNTDDVSILSVRELSGYHNITASIVVSEDIVLLDAVPKGGSMNLEFEMIGGTTFKIMGMMICNL